MLELGRPEEALASFSDAALAEPTSYVPFAHVALTRLILGDAAKALPAARKATTLAPDQEWGHRLVALAEFQLGKFARARDACVEAVRCDPDSLYAHNLLAVALQRTGDLAGALAAARRAATIGPEDSLALSTLAKLSLDSEDWSGAERTAHRIIRLTPDDAQGHRMLAVALRGQGRDGEAVHALELAAEVAPEDPLTERTLAALDRDPYMRMFLSPAMQRRLQEQGLGRSKWERLHRVKRLRPWWWQSLKRQPPPQAFRINLLILAAVLVMDVTTRSVTPLGLTAVFLFTQYLTTRRLLRWRRIHHPARSSWQSPGTRND
jgi:tetratricopeptide (TPR) repeat protein